MTTITIEPNPWNPLGVAGCATSVIGWVITAIWYADRGWGTFWAALVVFLLGTILSSSGWENGYGVIDRALPALGLILNIIGILVLLVLVLLVLLSSDESDTDLGSFRARRRRSQRKRRYRRRRRRRR